MLESSDTQVFGMFGKEGCALWEQLWAQGLVQGQFSSTSQGREVGSYSLHYFLSSKEIPLNWHFPDFIFLNYQALCLTILFLDLSERVTIAALLQNTHITDGSKGGDILAEKKNESESRGPLIHHRWSTSMLEVCWVVYWLIATLLVMTLQTAAQVHFIFKIWDSQHHRGRRGTVSTNQNRGLKETCR